MNQEANSQVGQVSYVPGQQQNQRPLLVQEQFALQQQQFALQQQQFALQPQQFALQPQQLPVYLTSQACPLNVEQKVQKHLGEALSAGPGMKLLFNGEGYTQVEKANNSNAIHRISRAFLFLLSSFGVSADKIDGIEEHQNSTKMMTQLTEKMEVISTRIEDAINKNDDIQNAVNALVVALEGRDVNTTTSSIDGIEKKITDLNSLMASHDVKVENVCKSVKERAIDKKMMEQLKEFEASQKTSFEIAASGVNARLQDIYVVEKQSASNTNLIRETTDQNRSCLNAIVLKLGELDARQRKTNELLAKVNAVFLSEEVFTSEISKIRVGIAEFNSHLAIFRSSSDQYEKNKVHLCQEGVNKATIDGLNKKLDQVQWNGECQKGKLAEVLEKVDAINKKQAFIRKDVSTIMEDIVDIKNTFGAVQEEQQNINETLKRQENSLTTIIASLSIVSTLIKDGAKPKTWANVASSPKSPASPSYPKEVQNAIVEAMHPIKPTSPPNLKVHIPTGVLSKQL